MKYWIVNKEDRVSLEIKESLFKEIELSLDEISPDLVVVVGGDGTFIHAVHQYPNAIFFCVHTGHLGFYSNYTIENLRQLIDDINKKEYQIETLDTLYCQFLNGTNWIEAFAVNEMTILMPPRTLILNVLVDEEHLETFRGTGLCISTPSGSTAYNKSLHGAVLDSNLHAIQIAEIAGINSNQYRTLSSPLLLQQNRKISLMPLQAEELFITVDNISYHLKDFQQAKVQLSSHHIQIAFHEKTSFVERIRRTFLKD